MEFMGGLRVGDVDVYMMLGQLSSAVLRWISNGSGGRDLGIRVLNLEMTNE
jgi:hypothetical protein